MGFIPRPVQELRSCQKSMLKKGKGKTLALRHAPVALKYDNDDLKFAAEPGGFQETVGGNSRDVPMAAFKLVAR